MRGLQAKEQEQAETSTVQPESKSAGTSGLNPATPTIQNSTPQMGTVFPVLPQNPIQRQCADCAKKQQEQLAPEGKDLKEKLSEAGTLQRKLTIEQPRDTEKPDTKPMATRHQRMSILDIPASQLQRFEQDYNPAQMWLRASAYPQPRLVDEQAQMRAIVQRAFAQKGTKPSVEPVQAKLTVAELGDKYEQEADTVARQVMEKINAPKTEPSVQCQSQVGGYPIIQRRVEKRVGTNRGVGNAGIGTLTCASIGNLRMAVFLELLSNTGDPFTAVDFTYTFSRDHQAVRHSSVIAPPSMHFEHREEFQFSQPGTVTVLLRGATPASSPFLRRVIGPIEADCELRHYPSGGAGPARRSGRAPENSVHDTSETRKRHTRNGSRVQRNLRRGREAHIFNDDINLSTLEQKVWEKGFYAGEFRNFHRWVYISPTQIGVRIQNGRADVALFVVEIKGQYRNGQLVYHLDPRTRASEDRNK